MEILKISSKSNPNSVAGAIAGLVKESNKAEMQAIPKKKHISNLTSGTGNKVAVIQALDQNI